jgi:hypothetical protein
LGRAKNLFLYNVFRESDLIIGENSLLLPYLTTGTTPFGEHDLKINESQAAALDISTIFPCVTGPGWEKSLDTLRAVGWLISATRLDCAGNIMQITAAGFSPVPKRMSQRQ